MEVARSPDTFDLEVDLLRVEELKPFARMAAALALSMVGAQAALPLMLIAGASYLAFVPGWLGLFVALAGLTYLVFPHS